MAHAPQPLDFNAFVEARKSQRVGGPETTGHEYTYISDKQMREAFEKMQAVKLAMQATVRVAQQAGQAHMLGSAVKVSHRQFPRIYGIVKECADTLQIATPSVYITSSPNLNAATLGTADAAYIFIHSALIDHFTDEELKFVIGHECGHIHNQHVVYLTTMNYLTWMAGVFLRWIVEPALIALRSWARRAEITCDRAGMLCAGKDAITIAPRALAKLALGSKRLYDEFNVEAFLEQYEEGKEGIGKYMEVFATHPWVPKRVLAIRVFAESALYRSSIGMPGSGLSMTEVDDRVRALLKGDA
jgi:Zn-dependent protease with chaperone function